MGKKLDDFVDDDLDRNMALDDDLYEEELFEYKMQ